MTEENAPSIHQVSHIGRSGRYVRQPGGYRAFIPKPLPPDPPVQMTGEIQQLLSQADHALGQLDGVMQVLPNSNWFAYMYGRKEAVLSSQIEGIQSTLHDLVTAEAGILQSERPDDVAEVINYVHAMRHGLERLQQLPVCVRLMREIHERLMRGVRGGHARPGEVRRSQNWLGAPGCTLNEAAFVPPPPDEAVAALGELEKFLNRPRELPALIWIGLVHVQFETIHPFLDGNGRLGRLLITFLLVEQKILHAPVLYLSHHFRRYQSDYYVHLQTARDQGDWEGWTAFFLRGVRDVSKDATDTVKRINLLHEKHRNEITEALGRAAGNGYRILESLYSRPLVTVVQIQQLLGVGYASANQLVSRLEKLGILEEITGRKRNRVYRYSEYLQLFEEPPPLTSQV